MLLPPCMYVAPHACHSADKNDDMRLQNIEGRPCLQWLIFGAWALSTMSCISGEPRPARLAPAVDMCIYVLPPAFVVRGKNPIL